MKKYSRIILTVLMIMVMLSMVTSVFAFNPRNMSPDMSHTNEIQSIGNQIMGVLQVVGVIVAVVILIILGIKYMMGSAEEKAEYKKTMIPYLVGAVLIFGAVFIAGMIFDWADGLNP